MPLWVSHNLITMTKITDYGTFNQNVSRRPMNQTLHHGYTCIYTTILKQLYDNESQTSL